MKFINKRIGLLVLFFGIFFQMNAQQVVVTDSTAIQPEEKPVVKKDSTPDSQRRKVDGIAAVVGEYVILDSDVELMYKDLQSQGISTADVTDCQLAGNLMESKLYAHQAIQDSIPVSDAEIRSTVSQQINGMVGQLGSMQKVLDFYHRDSEEAFRNELFELNKQRQLASKMQQKIIEGVEITPDEVRAYFEKIPKDSLPIFGDEVELSQIVIKPVIPEEEKQKVIDRLKEMREDIVDNGANFATKAVLYSQDPGSSTEGGKMIITRKDHLDKDFKDVAFSLKEGEVSQPFASQFGYHIIQVDKINGQNLEIRHILLIPDVTRSTVDKAKTQIDSIRTQILAKNLTFAKAAKRFSDEDETADDDGKLINPTTGDTRFELTKLDPDLYSDVVNLKEGEMSQVITDHDRTGRVFYKIIKIDKRFPEHKANYAQDFNKIKEIALRSKQLDAIEKWQKEKINETYVKVNGKYRNCKFNSKWIKD
ncbi:MAG: peptidylprolyl isomerase [Gillisia sp.]